VIFALRRLLLTVPLLVVVSFVVFLVGALLPGDPAAARFDVHGGPEARAAWAHAKGLDRPIPVRYARYMEGVVTRFDFGQSFTDDREIGPVLLDRFAATAELSLFALLIAVPVGIGVGVLGAARRGRAVDYAANVLALFGNSIPVFWLGMVLLLAAIAVGFRHFNGRYDIEYVDVVGGYTTKLYLFESLARREFEVAWSCAQYLLIPALALSTIPMAVITRMTRSSVLEEIGKDYVQTARAKGLRPTSVMIRHVLRNALVPIVTVTGLQTGALLSGAVLTETVFNWPGLGTLILDGVRRNDSPVIVGGILLVATVFIAVNLAVDLLYGVIDPRIRVGGA
jgi:ABC-type dipeptide/oligopeptide/nickel transport system permease component